MAVAYTIPAQKVDGYDIPSTVFTVYTGDITIGSSEPIHFDNALLAVALTQPDTNYYIVLQASRTTFSSSATYTYNGKTVYYTMFPFPPTAAVTFDPDLPSNIKTANTETNSISPYAAWLMVYGGYIATFSELEETANAIRAKTGSSTAIEWEAGEGFKDAITAIQTGVDGLKNAVCFSSPSSFTLETFNNTAGWNGTIEWTDGTHAWAVWDGTTTLTASSGLLYLRGISNTVISGDSSNKFILTGTDISCTGNIENLLDYATVALGNHPTMANYCYAYMFDSCTSLISAPELPATTLRFYCYQNMFFGCTNLISAPALPATTLASSCYRSMFQNCTSLKSTPGLPATTLAGYCYYMMFKGCTNLVSASVLPATTLGLNDDMCYAYMFMNCTSLTAAPELPATTISYGCYEYMFQNCTSLISTPAELPATTLTGSCYMGMFKGCTSLVTPPALPATTLATLCYMDMFYGCTALTSIPLLPATTLTTSCYSQMFRLCTNIKISSTYNSTNYPYAFRIPESGTGTAETTSLTSMFSGTGGTWTGGPTINTVYYLSKPLPIDFTIDSNAAATDVRLGKIAYVNGARISGSLANGTATAPASISGTSASVSTGTNTLTLSKTVSVTPSVTAGYIASGTAGNSAVSLTASVTTKAAATYTPTTSAQTIAAGTYLTGAQTINGSVNLVAGNIKNGVSIFGVTGTFAGDATVYNEAWTSRSTPTKSRTIGLPRALQFPSAISADNQNSTLGGFIAGGYYQDTSYTYQSTEVLHVSNELTYGAIVGLQGTDRHHMSAENVGSYALFAGRYSSPYTSIDSYNYGTLAHGTPTDLSFGYYPSYSCAVGNYALFGYHTTPVMNAYDTSLTRSTPTALSSTRTNINTARIGNYAIFGASASSNVVNTYNTSLTRGTATAFTTARDSYGAGIVGDYALFAGGSSSVKTVECYSNTLTHSVASTSLTNTMSGPGGVSLGDYVLFGGSQSGTRYAVEYYSATLTHGVCTQLGSTRLQQTASTCTIKGYALFCGQGIAMVETYVARYGLRVTVSKGQTYIFAGNAPVAVTSLEETFTVYNDNPISGVICKPTATITGQIT